MPVYFQLTTYACIAIITEISELFSLSWSSSFVMLETRIFTRATVDLWQTNKFKPQDDVPVLKPTSYDIAKVNLNFPS